jgi:hypothetical protein
MRERRDSPPPDDLRVFPFELPPAFAERLLYRWERRLLGVFSESSEVVVTDGEHTFDGNYYAYEELLYLGGVLSWLEESQIDFGSLMTRPTHWLLVDRLENCAYISPATKARDKVRTQRLEE